MPTQNIKIDFFIKEIPLRLQSEGGKINKDLLLVDWMAAMNSSLRQGKDLLKALEKAERINPNVWKIPL